MAKDFAKDYRQKDWASTADEHRRMCEWVLSGNQRLVAYAKTRIAKCEEKYPQLKEPTNEQN